MESKRILFQPAEYRELTAEEQGLLEVAYQKAIDALRRNITPLGFSACSLNDNQIYGVDANYRSVWARDGAMTVIWSLLLDDEEVRACQEATLRTLLRHQSLNGQAPSYVGIDDDRPEYGGVGGITSIDSVIWLVIAVWRFAQRYEAWDFLEEHSGRLQKAMDWLRAHDANNCGLLEIPEAGDWTDLFGASYHVLYDEVLWQRSLICFAHCLRQLGEEERAVDYENWATHVRRAIVTDFWPTTIGEDGHARPSFAKTQYSLGDTRYLVAQISPFSFSWRCDVLGNLLAYLSDVVGQSRAMMTFRFLWGAGANDPGPVKNLYPPVQAGDPEWRSYFAVDLLNLPNHYHNGGIWPFIGGLWVRYVHKLGMTDLARREMVKLARLCAMGVKHEWEFNEWHHGVTGRPMGKAYQAWSAASFLQACYDLSVEPRSLGHHE